MIYKNVQKQKIQVGYIVLLLFAIRAVSDVILAFDLKIIAFVIYACVICGAIYILYNRKIEMANLIYLLIPSIYMGLLIVHTYGGYSGDWLTVFIYGCCFFLMNPLDKKIIFNLFYAIIQINNVIALFMYACYVLKIDIGITTIPYYSLSPVEHYQKWGIFAIYTIGNKNRLCGIFNEPGGLGTVCALLFIARFKYSRKWEKAILLLTIFFTFSFAGYLLVFLFLAMYMVKQNWKNMIFLLLFAFLFVKIPKIDWKNEMLNVTAQRFSITENGLAGDNRTDMKFKRSYEKYLHTDHVWFGYGANYVISGNEASYRRYIVQFGIVGFFLIAFTWLFSSVLYAKRNKDCLLLIIFFMISIYQRPYCFINTYGYLILFGGMAWIHEKSKY